MNEEASSETGKRYGAFQIADGRLARWFSNARLVALAFVCYGVGLLGAWLAPSPILVGAAVLVYGAGLGIALPSIDAAISQCVDARYRAGALSLKNSTTFLGRSVSPVLFTGLAATTGYRTLLLGAGVLALGRGLLTVSMTDGSIPDIGTPEEIA